ncbi:serine/threonine-protein kinase [Roseimaritima ulvae]|uniref:Serine/threonine-protein kinase PrkC n=1 Tax=Roseimaritima ulvae TaxID=980254 RepID=A0A5B9R865_9BACT|nr:serine/threonine-protein kinase [Roseimaritima ulvae]QEG42753.1 Serine/threonine-protein kinase PrkC [Roseimaritima ulvae]
MASYDHATRSPELNPTVFEQLLSPVQTIRCPDCGKQTNLPKDDLSDHVNCTGCGKALSIVRVADTPSGESPGDRFQLLERLGGGGFGSVWKAYDSNLKRQVAIKIPHAARFHSTSRQRFLRESQAVAKLDHPGIVPVYDVCPGQNGLPVIVSKLIDGQSLSAWLAERRYVDSYDAAKVCADLADALSHAHLEGIVHRDLKPANIMMDVQGRSYVTDFGLAKDLQHEDSITCEWDVMGTAAYMSPEQASGQGHWDGRSTAA